MLRAGGQSTTMVSGGRKKVHTTFDDGSEMVEEYDETTNELLVRKRRARSVLGAEGQWEMLFGQEDQRSQAESLMRESSQNPVFLRKDTKACFEWRVRNLVYPADVYSVTIDDSDQKIVIRTSNKKYYKRIAVPELDHLKADLEPAALTWKHQNNTLVVSYKKPASVVAAEANEQKVVKNISKTAGLGTL